MTETLSAAAPPRGSCGDTAGAEAGETIERNTLPCPAATLDVTGRVCPMTWMLTKMRLEKLAAGDLLEVLIDSGDPVSSFPRSVKEDGHQIVRIQPEGDRFRVLVRRGQRGDAGKG